MVLPTIAISIPHPLLLRGVKITNIVFTIVGRVIFIWEAIKKRSHELIFKSDDKNKAKILWATNYAIEKLEEQ